MNKDEIVKKYAVKSAMKLIKEDIEYSIERNISYNKDELTEKYINRQIHNFSSIYDLFLTSNLDNFKSYLLPANPNSRAMFEEMKNIKLPKTILELDILLKELYSDYFLEKDLKEKEIKEKIEAQKLDFLKQNNFINYQNISAKEKTIVDKFLDTKFNFSDFGITTYRNLLKDNKFVSKHIGKKRVMKRNGETEYKETYNLTTSNNMFYEINKTLFDAINLEII